MENIQNLHTHTIYADGKDTPRELVQRAIALGMTGIGFSEHTYMAFSDYPYQMRVEQMADYQAEILGLKQEYRGVIDVFCGLEYEFYSDVPTEGFDYLIGSVHYLEIDGKILGFDRGLAETLAYVQNHFGGDGLQFAKQYYETVSRLPEKGNIDIIGHFDLLTKNNQAGKFIDTSSKTYLDYGKDAIHALQGKIPFFEVNTGAISRGYRTDPYPQMELLREFAACGFGAMITSDCHNKAFLDCSFAEARELLTEAGFKSRWILTDDGFREVAI